MEITEIKQRLTMSQVLHYYGLRSDKQNRIHCPFHEDKTPSFQLYWKTQTGYCFSSNCPTHGRSMDVIDFILHKENISKHGAILKAQELLGLQKEKTPSVQYAPLQQAMAATLTREQILQNMFQYFKNAVANSKPARDYLNRRGLDATKLGTGYNSGQFHHGARKEETLIQNCLGVGLLSAWGVNNRNPALQAYKPFAKGCIAFAMRNKANEITGLYFRSISNNEEAKHFYLKESKGLYPHYPKATSQKLIITESIIDAATLLQNEAIVKEYSVLAAYGTNRLNDEMKLAISGLEQLTEIVFAFDNDEAGKAATIKYTNEFKSQYPALKITTIELPCKDVNETLMAHNEDIFIHLLEQRQELLFSTEKEAEQPETPILPTLPSEPGDQQSKIQHPKLEISNPHKLIFATETATYSILGGLPKAMDSMKVMLSITAPSPSGRVGEGSKIRNRVDLYEDKQVEKLSKEVSEKLQLRNDLLEQDIYKLTELLENYREQQATESMDNTSEGPIRYMPTLQEKEAALEIANDKNLIATIKEKLSRTGIVGEDGNKTFLYIIAASHIQENPLNALIQGSSGSGKTNLLKGIYKTIPEESKKIYSRCSEKMLYNVPKYYFQNKLICFEDVDGLGEEAEYAWRELVSNGELVSGVSYKDEKGNIGVKELTVYGPITSIACTTKGAIYADNMSRLFLIAIDESKAQTQRINEYQAKEASGQIDKKEQIKTIQQLQNYSRLLQPYKVYNPYATRLKLPEDIQDERRLYKLYLHFIEIITVLHQYQRKQTNDKKLITEKQDCQIAKDLMFECIMLKMDELDGSLRQFFERLKDYVNKQNNTAYEFTQREIRQALQLKKTSLSYYINALIGLEYVQQTSHHINKGSRYRIAHFDNYRKMREDVKSYLQHQIDAL